MEFAAEFWLFRLFATVTAIAPSAMRMRTTIIAVRVPLELLSDDDSSVCNVGEWVGERVGATVGASLELLSDGASTVWNVGERMGDRVGAKVGAAVARVPQRA